MTTAVEPGKPVCPPGFAESPGCGCLHPGTLGSLWGAEALNSSDVGGISGGGRIGVIDAHSTDVLKSDIPLELQKPILEQVEQTRRALIAFDLEGAGRKVANAHRVREELAGGAL